MTALHTLLSATEAAADGLVDPADALERLHRCASSDPFIAPLLAAVEQIVGHWQRERDAVDAARERYERSLGCERRTRRGLAALLRTVRELAEPVRIDVVDPGEGRPEPPVAPEPDPAPPTGLDVRLLGHFELRSRGRTVEGFHGPKTPRVLRYLVANHDRIVPRDVLIDLFWSDATADSARRSLHQTIYVIRRALRDPSAPDLHCVVYENEGYAIDPATNVRCDADDLERCAAEGRRADTEGRLAIAAERFEAAVSLYRGDYLDDLPYDEWTLTRRRHLRALYLETANRLAALWGEAGRVDDALVLSQRVLVLDPCDEAAHRQAMQCYATLGNRGLMNRQFLACVDDMARLLGVEPTNETIDLHHALTRNAS